MRRRFPNELGVVFGDNPFFSNFEQEVRGGAACEACCELRHHILLPRKLGLSPPVPAEVINGTLIDCTGGGQAARDRLIEAPGQMSCDLAAIRPDALAVMTERSTRFSET